MPYRQFIVLATTLLLTACGTAPKTMSKTPLSTPTSVIGEYVSDGYAKRGQDYDLVAVTIAPTTSSDTINVKIHSRQDIMLIKHHSNCQHRQSLSRPRGGQ